MKYLITIGLMVIFVIGTASLYTPYQLRFKNLKVLSQSLTEKQLDKLMDGYCAALGIDCNYCHTKNMLTGVYDYASDNKGEKDIGRKMITMTKEINKNYFDFNGSSLVVQSVTCITCHHGSPIPLTDSVPTLKKRN